MKNPEKNKGMMKMTSKKLLTVFTAMLLAILPLQGMSAANATGVDTSLSTFTIEGGAVEDGDVIILPAGTTSVAVVATPTDPNASVSVTNPSPLVTFENYVVAEVTGSDGITTQTYTVMVYVTDKAPGFSNDATLSSITINGSAVSPGDLVEVAPLTTAVTVAVVTGDSNATSVVTGARNLVTGNNTVTVTVTAEDGVTTRTYTVKVRVLALSSNVALETFTVNGQAVRNGGRVFLEPGTQAATVVATTVDPTSSVAVTGATNLVAGENTLTATVTSAAGTTATYTVKLIVQVPSNISSLVVFKVSGARVADGTTVLLPAGTTAVAVTATPSDPTASVQVTGNADLQVGDNTLTVLVTAEDGTTSTYTVTLKVLQDDDTSLAVFQYDGSDVADGDVFDLENGTTSVEIDAQATSATSSVQILGADALVTGRNVVRINVTAQDESVRTYRLIFNVAPNTDATLESLTIANQDALGGDVTVPAGTRAVTVVPVTTDPFATFTIDGNLDLQTGENTVTVTVTAADGETTEEVTVTVTVLEQVLSDDTSLESLTIAGQSAGDGDSIEVPAGTRAVTVIAVTTDPFASFLVEGNVDLQPGENTVTVTVTAANGDTNDVSVTVVVLEQILSDDATLEIFKVNGVDVEDGSTVELPFGTRFVNVKVQTTDANASYIITGDGRTAALAVGDQDLVVSVTAANGDTTDYTVTLTVLPISENANLDPDAGLVINGETVDLELLNASGFYSVPLSTKIISVKALAEDQFSDVFVNSRSVLPDLARNFSVDEGVNNLTIKVIPQAGEEFAKTYVLKVYVGGADATVKSVKVGNSNITFNEGNEGVAPVLPNGTKTATLFVDPTVALAVGSNPGTKVEVDGGDATAVLSNVSKTWNISNLVTGDNIITITVTPGDSEAEQATYTVNIPVDLSSDAGLKTFKINDVVYPVGSTQILDLGVTEVSVDGETNNEAATFEAEGGDALVTGLNTLKITVTAEKGNTAVYTVTVIVPKAREVVVVGFPKLGVVKVDAKTNKAGNAVLTGLIKKLTTAKGTIARVQITNNFLIGKDKPAAGTQRAAEVQKFLQAAKVNGAKTARYELVAGPKTQKGTTITLFWY